MAVAKKQAKDGYTKVIIHATDKSQFGAVGHNGVVSTFPCGVEVEIPAQLIQVFKDATETRHVADMDENGNIKGSKEIEERRYIVEMA